MTTDNPDTQLDNYKFDNEIEAGLARAERMIQRQRMILGAAVLLALVVVAALMYWFKPPQPTAQVLVEEKVIYVEITTTPVSAIATPSETATLHPTETPLAMNSLGITPSLSVSPTSALYIKINWAGYCRYLGYATAANYSLTISGWKCVDKKG